MLIDDNEVDSLIHERLLKKVGLTEHVLIHTGARSAIEYLLSIQNLPPTVHTALPALILLDIDMPFMDGFQFLRAFGKLKTEIKERVRIVVLTASTKEADNQHSIQYPYVKGYLIKPLTKDMLASL